MEKSTIIEKLRPSIKTQLSDLESQTGLTVVFQAIPPESTVAAEYFFDPQTNIPTIFLASRWQDVDVAHELTHMYLELVKKLFVLAWRKDVRRPDDILRAFGRVRTYIDDEVVHSRLAADGHKIDGEVLKPELFDEIYRRSERYLKKARPRPEDGMAQMDNIGYGDLCRSSFLVQAELILKNYRNKLPYDRVKKTERFIDEFRRFRSPEANKADAILALFDQHDVQTIAGHKEILWKWAKMEKLDAFVGLSTYQLRDGRHILPYPA